MSKETIALAIIGLACSGCSSAMTVLKVDPRTGGRINYDQNGAAQVSTTEFPEGFRYSLPIPFLKVCPGAAGTLAVETIYLPDPDNTYAVAGKSQLSSHDLNVTVEQGLLKELTWNQDASAVAARAVEAAGTLAKTRLDRQVELDKEAAGARKAKEDAAAKALETAEGAVRSAIAQLESAEAVLDLLREQDPQEPTAILAAEIALTQAHTKLAAADRELERLFDLQEAEDAAVTQSARPAAGDGPPEAYGCILYRVGPPQAVDDQDSSAGLYTLVEAQPQVRWDTSIKLKAPKTTVPLALRLFIQGSKIIRPQGDPATLLFAVTSNVKLEDVPAGTTRLTRNDVDVTSLLKGITQNSLTKFTVELDPSSADGKYVLRIDVKRKKNTPNSETREIRFEVAS